MTVPGRADQREGPERWTIRLCPECGEELWQRHDNLRWSCPTHRDGITIRFEEVVPLSALREVEAERDRLREALEKIANRDTPLVSAPAGMKPDRWRQQAHEFALAALEGDDA